MEKINLQGLRLMTQKLKGEQIENTTSLGTFLVVQGLRLHASNAAGVCLIPGQGTKIPLATQCTPPPPKNSRTSPKGWSFRFQRPRNLLAFPEPCVYRLPAYEWLRVSPTKLLVRLGFLPFANKTID